MSAFGLLKQFGRAVRRYAGNLIPLPIATYWKEERDEKPRRVYPGDVAPGSLHLDEKLVIEWSSIVVSLKAFVYDTHCRSAMSEKVAFGFACYFDL
ncbi:MAG: hypothetical protein ACREX0_15605 [Noviherbaspirillum sp.]